MNSTHRKTIARAVAGRTAETYQQALARVVAYADAHPELRLDAAGRGALVDHLVQAHRNPAKTTPAPADTASTAAVDAAELVTFDLVSALHHLSALFSCGLVPHEALQTAGDCSQDRELAQALRDAGANYASEPSLEAAFAAQPRLNHPLLLAFARAGRTSGSMTDSLERAAKVFENDLRLGTLR